MENLQEWLTPELAGNVLILFGFICGFMVSAFSNLVEDLIRYHKDRKEKKNVSSDSSADDRK